MNDDPKQVSGKERRASSRSGRAFDLFDSSLMPVRRYKILLQTFLQRRGPGVRQAIADAIGTNRSFVSQMTSPAYDVPVPARHVRTISEIVKLTAEEERIFVEAYLEAHPDRAAEVLRETLWRRGSRELTISLPLLASTRAQRRLESLIERLAAELAASFVEMEDGATGGRSGDAHAEDAA
jgi:hypothetical protein